MADFCKQCSEKIFGEDFKELANITTLENQMQGLYAIVICEGCGPTQVDNAGKCIVDDCLEQGHTGIKCPVVTDRQKMLDERFKKEDELQRQLQDSLAQTIIDGQNAPDLLAIIRGENENE